MQIGIRKNKDTNPSLSLLYQLRKLVMQPFPILEEIVRIILVEIIPMSSWLVIVLGSIFLRYWRDLLSSYRSCDRFVLIFGRRNMVPGVLGEDFRLV